jgi:hypothetical protein
VPVEADTRAGALTVRSVEASSVERSARLLNDRALGIVRSLVGRDYDLGPEDLRDLAWTVALWVAIDIAEIGLTPGPVVTAILLEALETRARAELRHFRAFRVPRVRLAGDGGSVRVRVANAACDVDSLADPRVSTEPDLAQLVAQLEAGLSAQQRSVLPHYRSSATALTPAERKRLERVKRQLRERASHCPRIAAEVADYFDSL